MFRTKAGRHGICTQQKSIRARLAGRPGTGGCGCGARGCAGEAVGEGEGECAVRLLLQGGATRRSRSRSRSRIAAGAGAGAEGNGRQAGLTYCYKDAGSVSRLRLGMRWRAGGGWLDEGEGAMGSVRPGRGAAR